jgi:hypothetical protein
MSRCSRLLNVAPTCLQSSTGSFAFPMGSSLQRLKGSVER